MAYDTGNPIGSTDARDLYDNAVNLDKAVNQPAARWTDRLGVSRPSWSGITAYMDIGAYSAGIEITGYNEIFLHEGEYYRAAASTALPYTTTGSWSDDGVYFVSVGDAALRQELADDTGSDLVAFIQAGTGAVATTVQTKLREFVSVKDFGAKGDGVTNDADAFLAAATYVGQHGTVYVPDGAYILNSNLTDEVNWILDSGVTFGGTGALGWHCFKFGHGSDYYAGTYAGPPIEWMQDQAQTLLGRSTASSTDGFIAESARGGIAFLAASRTSDSTGAAGAMQTIGGYLGVVNDNTTAPQWGYAGYIDAYRSAGAGGTIGYEIDIINMGSVAPIAPNSMYPSTGTVALWLASGGEVTGAADASCALGIVKNGASFQRGIVFGQDALTGCDGTTGLGEAISMAKGHFIQWYNSAGYNTAAIQCIINTEAATKLTFGASGADITNESGTAIFRVSNYNAANVVNRVEVVGGATGVGVSVKALGSSTDIDISLSAKGNGSVGFGTLTQTSVGAAGGATVLPASPLGYMKVLINGSYAKIPYYNI